MCRSDCTIPIHGEARIFYDCLGDELMRTAKRIATMTSQTGTPENTCRLP
jgi:hypothetical protein